jgi:hypothetical protein
MYVAGVGMFAARAGAAVTGRLSGATLKRLCVSRREREEREGGREGGRKRILMFLSINQPFTGHLPNCRRADRSLEVRISILPFLPASLPPSLDSPTLFLLPSRNEILAFFGAGDKKEGGKEGGKEGEDEWKRRLQLMCIGAGSG